MSSTPPGREHRLRHWAYSLTRIHVPLELARLDVPWWTYRAIDEVDAWIASRAGEVRVFEWGSGASTIWLGRRVASVISIEHHVEFGAMLGRNIADMRNVSLVVTPPSASATPKIGSSKEGYGGLDFSDYVGQISAIGGVFDLIIIDGRAREACLVVGLDHLAPDGIIVFDNSSRRRYRSAIAEAPVTERIYRGLTPTLPYPDQTSILTTD